MKKATTLDEQIELYKNRGCELDMPIEDIENILLDVGYYRLGFYAFPFEETYPTTENRSHQYKQGTKFSEIVTLYKFDFALRTVLSKYINYIEVNFRTKLVYFASNYYKDDPTWFINHKIMAKSYIDNFDGKIYNEIRKNQKIIQRHHKKYINDKYAPAWKLFEYATFGSVISTYQSLLNIDIRTEIAQKYNIRNESVMLCYIRTMRNIRNMAAHDGVFFDCKLERQLKNGPALSINNENNSNLYSAILVMQYLLKGVSENLSQEFAQEIRNIFDILKNNEKLKLIVEKSSGYF